MGNERIKIAPTTILSIIFGILTVLLGILLAVIPCGGKTQVFWTFFIILLNFLLHVACYIHSVNEKKPQNSILSISIAEAFLVVVLLLPLFGMEVAGVWQIYAFYLVVNGSSLVAMLSKFSIGCGILAVLSGIWLFFVPVRAVVGLSLVINGAERVLMAASALRRKLRDA